MLNMYVLYAAVINVLCIITINANNVVFPCTTPDQESAYCMSLFSCPGLMKSLSTLAPTAIQYVQRSICLGCNAGDFMVCCGKENLPHAMDKLSPADVEPKLPISTPMPVSKSTITLPTLIPDRRYCGLQHTDDRFFNDTATALDEFPWLVHIKFTDIYSDYKLGDRCTGVLLNNKYVLTDSVCASSALKVRLGQYDAAHKVTCLQNPQAHECNEGTIEVRIDKKINLQDYVDGALYALTLIRLANGVDYTDFVRPICLPMMESNRPDFGKALVFSGWGAKPEERNLDDAIKKRLVYNGIHLDKCTERSPYLKNVGLKGNLTFECYKPQKSNKDIACFGDHGGPLMYSDSKHQWSVESVAVEVMYDIGKCSPGNPLIAIKITPDIIKKILENIEP